MKIQIVSDLHLEFYKNEPAGYTGIEAALDADVLIIAGDIAIGTKAIDVFKDWPVPVLYIAGNHEYYGGDMTKVTAALREDCAGTQIHFMERDAVVIDGVRFLGTTLWTDYLIYGRGSQVHAMLEAGSSLSDHKKIRLNGKRFIPRDAMFLFVRCKDWLSEQLDTPHDGATVVVTHHGPHWESVHPKYREGKSLLSAAYVSDLSALMGKASLWIHGHVHDSFDYELDGTRVLCNPRGYPEGYPMRKTGLFENVDFDPNFVVEVKT